MCNGMSASDTINTCNGNNCYNYAKSHTKSYPGQPLGWTENEGWFQYWARAYNPDITNWANRSPQDMAYSVALWFAAGAAHHNYYMYYGGNHVGWTAGSGIANYYADGVNYHADGLANEPKKSHLMRLHNVIAEYGEYPLMESEIQIGHEIVLENGNSNVFAYSYYSYTKDINMTFLCNIGSSDAKPKWNNKEYELPKESVSILDNDGNVLYATSDVNTTGLATKRMYETIYDESDLIFSSWTEEFPLFLNKQKRPDMPTMNERPLEQIRFTNDTYEYLIYSTNFTQSKSMNNVSIVIYGRTANAYLIYLDDKFVGNVWDGEHSANNKKYTIDIGSIVAAKHTLSIVSSSLGIHNGISNQQPSSAQDMKGFNQLIMGQMNLTMNKWNHWIGRSGEILNVATNGMNNVQWTKPVVTSQAMTWYKTMFKTPNDISKNDGVILIDIGANGDGMKRGHWWLNGMDMGHYNNVILSNNMVQQFYFIPKDYFAANGGQNTLIFAEELNDPKPSNVKIVFSTFVIP